MSGVACCDHGCSDSRKEFSVKVLLVSAYNVPRPNFGPDWVKKHAKSDLHEIVEDPQLADIIIFVETIGDVYPYFFEVLRHPLYRLYKHKCVLYHINDTPHTLCRTISPSVEKKQPNPATRHSFHYIARIRDNHLMEHDWDFDRKPKYLFSFVGDPDTNAIRKKILELQSPQSFLHACSGANADTAIPEVRNAIQRSFINSVIDSHFVLCPKGYGPSSMRLFEVMQLARVPVIISDSWVPVPGVDWSKFAVFVRECEIKSIPEILENLLPRAVEMGKVARQVWLQKFAPERSLDELVTAAILILSPSLGVFQNMLNWLELLRRSHWKNLMGYLKNRVL